MSRPASMLFLPSAYRNLKSRYPSHRNPAASPLKSGADQCPLFAFCPQTIAGRASSRFNSTKKVLNQFHSKSRERRKQKAAGTPKHVRGNGTPQDRRAPLLIRSLFKGLRSARMWGRGLGLLTSNVVNDFHGERGTRINYRVPFFNSD